MATSSKRTDLLATLGPMMMMASDGIRDKRENLMLSVVTHRHANIKQL